MATEDWRLGQTVYLVDKNDRPYAAGYGTITTLTADRGVVKFETTSFSFTTSDGAIGIEGARIVPLSYGLPRIQNAPSPLRDLAAKAEAMLKFDKSWREQYNPPSVVESGRTSYADAKPNNPPRSGNEPAPSTMLILALSDAIGSLLDQAAGQRLSMTHINNLRERIREATNAVKGK